MRRGDIAGRAGRYLTTGLLYPIDLLLFTYYVFLSDNPVSRIANSTVLKGFVAQTIFSGVDGLKPVGLMALAMGVGFIAPLMLFTLSMGSQNDVVTLLIDLVVMELGPLLTAFILIARSGSAITVDLGQMRLHREIKTLESMGIDIRSFLLVPRMASGAISQLVLAIYFSFLTVAFAVFVISIIRPVNIGSYFHAIAIAFSLTDLLAFCIKNIGFGVIIATIACFEGLRTTRSATEIPKRTQSSVINSLFFILAVNVLSAVLTFG